MKKRSPKEIPKIKQFEPKMCIFGQNQPLSFTPKAQKLDRPTPHIIISDLCRENLAQLFACTKNCFKKCTFLGLAGRLFTIFRDLEQFISKANCNKPLEQICYPLNTNISHYEQLCNQKRSASSSSLLVWMIIGQFLRDRLASFQASRQASTTHCGSILLILVNSTDFLQLKNVSKILQCAPGVKPRPNVKPSSKELALFICELFFHKGIKFRILLIH